MSAYNKLSAEQLAQFDNLIDNLKANPAFIAAVVKAIPAVVRVVAAVTPAIAGGAVQQGALDSALTEAHTKLLQGNVTADDLVLIRKSLS